MKPIFGRSTIVCGSQPRIACLKSALVVDPGTFIDIGSAAASSIMRWSQSGERASSEWPMAAISIFTRRSSER
jgi:hypothetical protein